MHPPTACLRVGLEERISIELVHFYTSLFWPIYSLRLFFLVIYNEIFMI
jgi:hypothetical protein